MRLTKSGRTILVAVLILTAVIVIRMVKKETRAISIEEIERQKGVSVAVENPVRMDFTDYLYCDGEVDVSARYVLRSSIDDVVESVYVDVGDIVKKEQILVEFRKNDLQADISAKRAANDEAKRNYGRYNALLEKGGVSKNMVESKRTAMENAAAALIRAESRMGFARVCAPVGDQTGSVQVAARFVDPGERKGKGDALITLVDLSTIEVRAMVPESGVRFAKIGGELEFQLEDEIDWRTAAITRVSPSSDHPNRFFDVFVRFNNERVDRGWVMRPGMYVQVRMPRTVNRNALAVRSSVVKRKGTKRFVFVVRSKLDEADNSLEATEVFRVEQVEVTTGLSFEGHLQLIEGGIKEDALLVSSPRDDLRDGTKVRIMKREGAL